MKYGDAMVTVEYKHTLRSQRNMPSQEETAVESEVKLITFTE